MVGILALVVGGLVTFAVVYRLSVAVADRRSAHAAVAAETARVPTGVPTGAPTAAPQTGADPEDPRRAHDRAVAEAARSVPIELYGASWCPSCRKARAWLDAEGIAYTYRDTTDDANRQAMRALNPRSTIPTIDIEGQVLVGFDPRGMRSAIRRAAEARVARSARND